MKSVSSTSLSSLFSVFWGREQDGRKSLKSICLGLAIFAALVSYFIFANQQLEWRSFAVARLICAMILIYGLPGYFLLRMLMPKKQFELLELLPIIFGLSHIFVVAECVIVMLLHQNLERAFELHGMLILALAAFSVVVAWLNRKSSLVVHEVPRQAEKHVFRWAALLTLAVTVFLLFKAGGLWKNAPTDEEIYNLVLTRKFLQLDQLSLNNIMFRKEMPSTYLFAPYPFMTAMMAKASALNPIIVYTHFRAFWGLISLSAFYSIVLVLMKRRDIAAVTLICGSLLAISNAAGQFEEKVGAVFWAQLIPMSHHADFALGVLLPVMFLFLFYCFRDERWNSVWVWITPCLILSGVLTHTREGVQVLLYAGFMMLAFLIFQPREWRRILPLAVVSALTVIAGKIFQQIHQQGVPHIVLHEQANRVMIENLFALNFEKFHPFGLFTHWYYNSDLGLFRPFFSFALILTPVLLLIRSRAGWNLILWSSLAVFMMIYRIPPLTFTLMKATYSEMLSTPARYLSLFSFILFGLVVFAGLYWVDRLAVFLFDRNRFKRISPFFRWIIFVDILFIGGSLFFLATHAVYWISHFHFLFMDAVYLWIFLGGLAAYWFRRSRPDLILDEAKLFPSSFRFPKKVLAGLFVVLLPFFFFENSGRDLVQRAIDMKPLSDYKSESEFYNKHYAGDAPPYAMIDFVRNHLPGKQVIVYPPKGGMSPLMFVNQYAFSAGVQPYLADVGFVEKYFQVLERPLPQGKDLFDTYRLKSNLYSQILTEEEPFFSPNETCERLGRFVDGFGVNYLLAPSASAEKVLSLRQQCGKPGKIVYSTDGWSLLAFI